MKQLFFIVFVFIAIKCSSQNCLELSLTATMDRVPLPASSAAANFSVCTVPMGSGDLKFVKDAGPAAAQLQQQMEQTEKDFTNTMMQGYSQSNAQDMMNKAQQQASQQNMNPQQMSQQQMMQQAMQQQMGNYQQDKPELLKLVYKAQSANMQLTMLNAKLAKELQPARDQLVKDLAQADKIYPDGGAGCPGHGVGEGGQPDCGCVKGRLLASYNAHITAYNNYDATVLPILQNYKTLFTKQLFIIDDCIKQLQNGKKINSATYKQMLFSQQSSAYGSISSFMGITTDVITTSGKSQCQLANLTEGRLKLACAS